MRRLLLAPCFLLFLSRPASSQAEVIYHVFQRSFFDSNGDGNGDLKGIREKLDYLEDLGVTSILLTPLYLSDFYHNYFANDFEKIDPSYGLMGDYLALVREIHRRKMKIYQDVEMQYVTGKHPWFIASYKNPGSPYSRYLVYNDTLNEKPDWFFGVPEFTTFNNSKEQIIMVNMKDPAVMDYTKKVLDFWIDPDGNGNFDDGVDGFRLDHMMDDLDYAGKQTQLFTSFWAPLLQSLRAYNPSIRIIAEQADWGSYGFEYLSAGKVDRVFAFRLKQAIESFDKKKIMEAADSCFIHQASQVVFIENHDTRRFASVVSRDPGKLKAGAALNILAGGIPSIYYGQELGMTGTQIRGQTDGNDIPIREAFEWNRDAKGGGMAFWYRNTGPWWDSSQVKANDGISVEEQLADSSSLLHYYKALLQLRKNTPALYAGKYLSVDNPNANVLTFERSDSAQHLLIAINLSAKKQATGVAMRQKGKGKKIFGPGRFVQNGRNLSIELLPYECMILIY